MNESHQRCQTTRQWLDQGAHLVDVRSIEEYQSGALPGAVNLPVQLLPHAARLLDAKQPIVVYCGTGMRSAQAKQLLEQAGVEAVHDLGGFENLQQC